MTVEPTVCGRLCYGLTGFFHLSFGKNRLTDVRQATFERQLIINQKSVVMKFSPESLPLFLVVVVLALAGCKKDEPEPAVSKSKLLTYTNISEEWKEENEKITTDRCTLINWVD
jgi:hypothetical protein